MKKTICYHLAGAKQSFFKDSCAADFINGFAEFLFQFQCLQNLPVTFIVFLPQYKGVDKGISHGSNTYLQFTLIPYKC